VTNDTQTKGEDSWKLTINVKCEPVKADFTADATKGISPFKVQFEDLSENAARWLWDFGDGTTSTEQHPEHIFYNPPRKHFTVTLTVWDCCEEYTDTITREYFITSMRPANVNFNAYPIVGPPELQVQFMNHSGGVITHWLWEYGDGMSDEFRSDVRAAVDPMHGYTAEGAYSVSLTGWGPGGTDALAVEDLIYVDENYLALELLDGGATADGEGWDDVIDHDIISPDASTTAMSGDAWAMFRFVDTTKAKLIHKIRLMTNNADGSRYTNHLTKEFEVMVSMDGVNFTSGFAGTIDSKYGWEIFEFEPVEANYLKLLLSPRGASSPYVTMCEFQVFGTEVPDSKELLASTRSDETSTIVQLPEEFGLSQNYPNPFNPETAIRFQIPEAADVLLSIYNIRGQLIATLLNERREAGYHQAVWNGRDAAGMQVGSGIYFYSIRATGDENGVFSTVRKMTLIR
jgi:PKD repeat protein